MFNGDKAGQKLGAFVQDTFSPIQDLNVSLGIRVDRHAPADRGRPRSGLRVGVAYHLFTMRRRSSVVHHSRLFMLLFSENLLLSSSAEARPGSPDSVGGKTQPEKQHAFEVGSRRCRHTPALMWFTHRKNISQRRGCRSVPRHDRHLPVVGLERPRTGCRGAP